MITLYKKDKSEALRVWQIEIEGAKFRTHTGIINGALVTSEWTTCLPKNVGRSNATTAEEQTLRQVEAIVKKKKEEGYSTDPNTQTQTDDYSPMLAYEFQKYGADLFANLPVYYQPKLDGLRIVAQQQLVSRNGKVYVAMPHILEEVKSMNIPYALDGEGYNHLLKDNFNKILSLIKQTKPTQDDLDNSREMIKYYVYDIMMPGTFAQRNAYLKKLLLNEDGSDKYIYVKYVDTYYSTISQIEQYWKMFTDMGYEGVMVRQDAEYVHDRSRNLLKYKKFKDAEFKIIDILEGVGNRSGMMGKIILQTGDQTFEANALGNRDYYTELLKNKNKYIGLMATLKYQNLTPKGIPRFGIVTAIRDYE